MYHVDWNSSSSPCEGSGLCSSVLIGGDLSRAAFSSRE